MTTPDIATLATYGGALQNYQGQAVVNPLTDRDAAAANEAYTDCAAMTHTAIRTWTRFTAAASTGALVLVTHDALWGNAAPVTPTLARSALGVFTVTYPATITDELGHTKTPNLRAAWGQARVTSIHYDVDVTPTAPNVLTVRVFAGGSASDAVGIDLDIFAI